VKIESRACGEWILQRGDLRRYGAHDDVQWSLFLQCCAFAQKQIDGGNYRRIVIEADNTINGL
jgi:hypothetical protein